jgi:hypothetical protein
MASGVIRGNERLNIYTAMNVSENTLVIRLRSFMEVRNECTHTGSSSNVPTTSDIQDYCDLVEQTASGTEIVSPAVLARDGFAAAIRANDSAEGAFLLARAGFI